MSAFDYFTFQTEEQINRLQIYIEENFTNAAGQEASTSASCGRNVTF